jgi:hypothetical protein
MHDPFAQLFDMYRQHANNQIALTQSLLSLKVLGEQRRSVEARYLRNKDATSEADRLERDEASRKLDDIDDQIGQLEKKAKDLIELLTGVSLDVIAEFGL